MKPTRLCQGVFYSFLLCLIPLSPQPDSDPRSQFQSPPSSNLFSQPEGPSWCPCETPLPHVAFSMSNPTDPPHWLCGPLGSGLTDDLATPGCHGSSRKPVLTLIMPGLQVSGQSSHGPSGLPLTTLSSAAPTAAWFWNRSGRSPAQLSASYPQALSWCPSLSCK